MIDRKYGVVGVRPYRPEPQYKLSAPTHLDHVDRLTIDIPRRDQQDEGCCTGFGTARAVQAALKGDPLSPQFAYFLGRVREATQDVDAGAIIGDVVDGILEYGIAKESVYPYIAGTFAVRPSVDVFADATRTKGKVKAQRVIGLSQIKNALAAGHPVVFGMSVPEYFESDQVAVDGWVRLPTNADRYLGGHCMCIDGFDDRASTPFLWVANSWGAWGQDGYCRLDQKWVSDQRRLIDDCWAVMPA